MAQLISGPSALDLVVYAGDANTIAMEIYTQGGPTDTTGAALAAQARVKAPAATIVAEAVITAVDEVAGRWTMSWDGEALRAVLSGQESWKGVWDLQITWAGAALPKTLLRGDFTILHDVTRVVAP